MTKYIFVTGGVISSLGKGIACASIGKILESQGLKISLLKCDPYLNVDPGTMNPYQHGEVYVTVDGAETDLDLGHYERFTNAKIRKINNVTSGQVYNAVISRERRGDYLGKTIQVIPHITDEIKSRVKLIAKESSADVLIIEVGGTVGDIESLPYLEAARQFGHEVGRDNCIFIHLTLVPYIRAAEEIKTKPTQHSVGKLREIGIQPDILLCRTEKELSEDVRSKIALFCNVDKDAVIQALDAKTIYQIPLAFKAQGLDKIILKRLGLRCKNGDLSKWKKNVVDIIINPPKTVKIAVIGKYIQLQDAYKSIYEALTHGGLANRVKTEIVKIDSENFEKHPAEKLLKGINGILVPGGFGTRGVEGKIRAIKYARTKKVPFLGICLGMQCCCIEFARNVCNMPGANSTEFDKAAKYPLISLLEEQRNIKDLGGTMRLGIYECSLKKETLAHRLYGENIILERHRHRYEFNNMYKEIFEKHGFIFSGMNPKQDLVEIVEIKGHPYFIACQFHPEFQSKPDKAHVLFSGLIRAALKK